MMEAVLTWLGTYMVFHTCFEMRLWLILYDSGFQPIGSYHRQLSNAARATAT